ncbi:hypothetical protein ACQKNS_25030 [Peribacillus sp. NPDC094092]|uniref:hypothetical protein n=1 Tax=Peribacillus sp. NPDC094092 TaxID=3390611 RepID=UPI003D076FD1
MNKFFTTLLGLSILANMILGFMYVGQKTMTTQAEDRNIETQKQMVQLKSKANAKDKELIAFQRHATNYEIEHSEEVKSFVDDTFRGLFNYDNKNYAARFDQVKDRLAESVMSKLKASGEMGSMEIEFKNEVKSLHVYLSAVEKDQAKALVMMETQYSVGGSAFPRKNQLYEVTVELDGEERVVDKLELMGSFEPFEEN